MTTDQHAVTMFSAAFAWHMLSNIHVAGAGLLSGEGTKPGQLALAVYCQLEDDVDDMLAAQAVKCLVHLSKEMLEADRATGLLQTPLHERLVPAPLPGERKQGVSDGQVVHESGVLATAQEQDGTEAADSDAESDGEEEQDRQELGLDGAPGLTLQGLVRRMAKMAGDR